MLPMYNLRLYHDDDRTTFHRESLLFFSQCGPTGRISLGELLRLTADAAVEDYRERGMSYGFLAEHDIAILVSRLAFRFHSMPRADQRVNITTWEEKPESLQLRRAYEIAGEGEGLLVSGMSSWLLVNPKTRRIIPSRDFTLRPPVELEKDHDCLQPGKIVLPADMDLWHERTICLSDIDANCHTNNCRYGAFVEDALPPALRDREFTDFRLNYSKEAKLDQRMQVFGRADEAERKLVMVGKTEDGNSFEAELYWK